jgi:hypothetical protein
LSAVVVARETRGSRGANPDEGDIATWIGLREPTRALLRMSLETE